MAVSASQRGLEGIINDAMIEIRTLNLELESTPFPSTAHQVNTSAHRLFPVGLRFVPEKLPVSTWPFEMEEGYIPQTQKLQKNARANLCSS